MYQIYVRQTIEAGDKDSDEGRTVDVKEVRKRFEVSGGRRSRLQRVNRKNPAASGRQKEGLQLYSLISSLYSALWPSEALRTIVISLQSGNLKIKLPLLSVLPDRINFPLPSKTSIGAFIAFFPFEKKLSVYTSSPSTQAKTCTL